MISWLYNLTHHGSSEIIQMEKTGFTSILMRTLKKHEKFFRLHQSKVMLILHWQELSGLIQRVRHKYNRKFKILQLLVYQNPRLGDMLIGKS